MSFLECMRVMTSFADFPHQLPGHYRFEADVEQLHSVGPKVLISQLHMVVSEVE